MENKNLPAFPFNAKEYSPAAKEFTDEPYYGLSKREIIAAMALQGLLSNSAMLNPNAKFVKEAEGMLSMIAVNFSDALLKELEK